MVAHGRRGRMSTEEKENKTDTEAVSEDDATTNAEQADAPPADQANVSAKQKLTGDGKKKLSILERRRLRKAEQEQLIRIQELEDIMEDEDVTIYADMAEALDYVLYDCASKWIRENMEDFAWQNCEDDQQ